MKTFTVILAIICVGLSNVRAEVRTWTSITGQTIEGEYVSVVFENVTIKDNKGELRKLPMDQLSEEDRNYVELQNPPVLSVDYRESIKANKITADSWIDNGGGSHANHEVTVCDARFGALIKQDATSKVYNHEFTVELYILTAQNLDPDNYRLIAHTTSKPFKLTKENNFRYVYDDPREYKVIYYNLYSKWKRGEIPSKYLILVRDERGEIVAYKARSEWMYKNLDKLEKLPVSAWMNDKCTRVHTTSPPMIRNMR